MEILKQKLAEEQGQLSSKRECLKLLYERGEPLEKVVRNVLRALGATVTEPIVSGKEDGWITVQLGDKTLEGVLEVKSTRSDHFDRDGLRQLSEWKTNGALEHGKEFKGIFIGINAVEKHIDERPDGFHQNWKQSSEMLKHVALTTKDLLLLYIADTSGRLDREAFWQSLFSTNGVFDAAPFLGLLTTEEKSYPSEDEDIT